MKKLIEDIKKEIIMELLIKKCLKCGAIVEVLNDCTCQNCGIRCCDENMMTLKPNSVDASFEKHVPNYEIKNNKIFVSVNHVMEAEHFIEAIFYVFENTVQKVMLKAGQKPEAVFEFLGKGKVFALCNKHGLWEKEII
jgi:superoxide reductase